jgi:hypothetical protein
MTKAVQCTESGNNSIARQPPLPSLGRRPPLHRFRTAGEIARQKESLLAALPFDVELTETARARPNRNAFSVQSRLPVRDAKLPPTPPNT